MKGMLRVAVLMVLSLTFVQAQSWVGPTEYVATVSATAVNTAVSFGFKATTILVVNDGSNTVFVTLASSTATTSKFPVKSSETFSIQLNSPAQGMGLICATSETATVRVGAWR